MIKPDYKMKYVKIWLYSIIILSIFVLLVQFIYRNDITNYNYESINFLTDSEFLKSITPEYPPPLFNFNDPVLTI